MGTFTRVRSIELLLAAGTLLGASGALAALLAVRRRRRAPALARAAHAIPEALGDAILVLDGAGRIVDANDAAGALAGAALVGRGVAELGPDLPVLAKGLARGAASGQVTLASRSGSLRARAALLRLSSRPPRDLVVLRADPPRPPPLPPPRSAAQPRLPAPAAPEIAEARAVVAAAAAAVRDPLARAARAASLLRLSAPALAGRAAAALAELERALDDAERRGAALAAAGQPGARHALDLAALVEDLAGSLALPPGVELRVAAGEARVHGDDRPLRSAVREVLRCAAAALPAGGRLAVRVRAGPAGPLLEIGLGGGASASVAALARALLAPQGARVEEEETRRAGGPLLRIALPPAPAEPVAPA